MRDLEQQIRAYATELDRATPSVEAIAERAAHPPATKQPRPRWSAVAVAAAAVVIVVGSVTVLFGLREPTEQTASTSLPSTTTTTEPGATTTVAPVASPSSYLTLVSDTPVYAGGEGGDVDGLPMVTAGPVALNDGTYHTLFSAGGNEVWETIFHATSSDGSTWSVDPEPVRMPGIEGAVGLVVGSLDRMPDGTWVTFFHVVYDIGGHGNHIYESEIRMASSPDPGGPWTPAPMPALLPGTGWDSGRVAYPTVVRNGDRWLMFYAGSGADDEGGEKGPSAVGLAMSDDGITWERIPEPVFTGDEATWEEGVADRPTVVSTPDGLLMLYAGRTGGSRGLAMSQDGMTWRRVSDTPVLTALDVPRPAIFTTSMVFDAGTTRVYVANGGHRSTSAVYEMVLDMP